MAKNLVIVESPAKARTIASFLGSDFEVKSSYGHIRDLPKKKIGVDIKGGFKPDYEISPDKKKVVKELKQAAKGRVVWLASDEDREGEAIAWHISHILGLEADKTKRIVFHEITKPAIEAAVAKPRTLDMKLVDAQQARRVLDRLVGYELSPVLWKKVRAGLSAGRVQSVAVRLIVERERNIKAFKPKQFFRVSAIFEAKDKQVPAELVQRIIKQSDANTFLEAAKKADFKVDKVEQKPGTRSPGAPFTTSTLQQEASRRLGFGVRQTMTLAQRLYEAGLITYMRTDSLTMSPLAIDAAKKYITKTYGQDYSSPRQYQTKNASAQQAHEAIRPTKLDRPTVNLSDNGQKKLYELIWRRALGSQMSPANIERTEVIISMSSRPEQFTVNGEVLKFDGFLKVYGGGKEDIILPQLEVGQSLSLFSMSALESFSRPPARYSEASLVKKLEELGIGRPSTYAPTISTIQDRDYVEKKDLPGEPREIQQLILKAGQIKVEKLSQIVGADRAKLVPTGLADIVTDFLVKYFGEIVDYDFTARAEKEFDDIEEGNLSWQKMLEQFYKRFHPLVEKSAEASRQEASQMRKLGVQPKSGKAVFVRYGRYGPVLQLGETGSKEDKEAPKPKFAPLPAGTNIENITLAQALPMFNLPRTVGKTADGQEITADIGPYGPYIRVGKLSVSLKEADPLTITEVEAQRLIAEKQKTERERVIAAFGNLQILRGPYGPYVSDGKINARIPKDQDPEKLTEADAKELIKNAPPKNRRWSKNKTAAKKR